MLRSLRVAVEFLTTLPLPRGPAPGAQALGRSLLWYPLVGALLGALLLTLATLLAGAPPLLSAALLLALWCGLTGGLHLDGLADSADAWVGGRGDVERTLAIMKDPRSGPAAVVALTMLLLLKLAALHALLEHQAATVALLVAPALARAGALALLLTTPYVRAGGLGESMSRHLPRTPAWVVLLATGAIVLLLTGADGVFLLLLCVLALVTLRALMISRMGGTTGDTTGAALELLETLALLTLALLAAMPGA